MLPQRLLRRSFHTLSSLRGNRPRAGRAAHAAGALAFWASVLAAPLAAQSAPATEFASRHCYVCSEGGDSVLELDADGTLLRTIGTGSGLSAPTGLAFGADGRLWVASAGTDEVFAFDATGTVVAQFGAGSGLVAPHGLAIGPSGHVLVGNLADNTVLEFSAAGALVRTIGAGAGLSVPSDLAFGADGHLFVASAGSGRITEFDTQGTALRELGAGSSLTLAIGLTFGPDGRLRVSSGTGNSVVVLEADGTQGAEFGAEAGLDSTSGLAFGPDELLWVVSRDQNLITLLDASGGQVRQIGAQAGLSLGGDLAFAPQRLPVTLSGTLSADGAATVKLKDSGVLSVAVGSQRLLLALDDDLDGSPLATLFGSATLALSGFESRTDDPALAVLQGELRTGGGDGTWTLTLVAQAKGATDAAGNFSTSKLTGSLWGRSPGGQVQLTLKSGKPLN